MAPLTELERDLIIVFSVVGGVLLLLLVAILIFFLLKRRWSGEQKPYPGDDAKVSEKKQKKKTKPPPLPPVPSSTETSTSTPDPPTTPSTTSENLSYLSSPKSPHIKQLDPLTPGSSLIFPETHSKYAGMRVGRTAWTSAYMPPVSSQTQGGLENGAAGLQQPPVGYASSDQYRTRSSAGFEPITEEVSASDPYIARAQAGGHRTAVPAAPASDRGSQTNLLGAAVEPASNQDDVPFHGAAPPGAGPSARMWPRRSGYAPFSQSALDAARRRTQDLYNARRSQLGPQTRPPPTNPPFLPPSPRPAGRHAIWSGTSGRPQSGSYVIGPRRLDEADPSYYRAQGAQGDDGESSVYFPEENQNPKTAKTHTIVVEAAVEPHQPQSPDGPAEPGVIGDAFRFLDEFEE